MPVSRISVLVDCSSKLGAFLCIGSFISTLGFSLPSIASPRTLNIRPKVCSPTGTDIGLPVAKASIPLLSPSVVSIAIHLTTSSPRCCATSTVSVLLSSVFISIASFI